MAKQYEFLAIDEGKQNLLRADTGSGKVHWVKSLADYPTARAMERIDNDKILMGYDRGYCLFDIKSGDIIHDCSRWTNVTSASRKADGTTLLTGLNLEGHKGVCVLTLDTNDQLIQKEVCEGDYVRLMTVADNNRYLLSTNDHIRICDDKLQTIQTLNAKGFLHAWKTLVVDDGILVSAGYGAFMAKFSPDGELLFTFGKTEEVPSEVKPNFYASFCINSDGSILLANWQGHGPDNGDKGRQLLHFSADGQYLNSWSFSETVSSLQGLLILD